ncbi:MAG: xanthine dehydrogenase family protein subunit M [Deltaproteobacteria bacterium]|nr:xanthine dehydrogenase family protein subunit M [Deltaproteobacteria bacterium]
MKRFDYIRPGNMADAIAALQANDEPYLLAGGTDLLIGMKTNAVKPKCLIDLKGIPGIDCIEYDNGFKLGALTTVRDVEVSPLIREKIPALSEAAATLGSIQIRNRATIGGNLCHGSPAADMAAILLAMNCELQMATGNGAKTMGLDQFFTGPNSTVLNRNEVLAQIIIPKEIGQFKGIYLKHGPRKAMDIGIVNIAILLDADVSSGFCNQIMIALGAVAPRPIRAKKAEALLNANRLTPELIQEAAEAASDEATPISDFRASAGYRKDLVKNLVAKGIDQILNSKDPS